MFKVESGIEITRRTTDGGSGGPQKYPFPNMAVGDSFEFEGDAVHSERVRCAAKAWAKNHEGKFAVRKTGEQTHRCWRLS